MFEKSVLNKGFVRLLNMSGAIRRTHEDNYDLSENRNEQDSHYKDFDSCDTDPALVARTSFGKGLQEHTQKQDEQLVEYLIRNNHTSPFEFTTVYMELKLPIFVARQIMRHRACTFNEISGRYVTLPNDWYIPKIVRGKHSGGNKQGSEDNLSNNVQDWFRERLEESCQESYNYYELALSGGVCPEQARMFLHLNHYTTFVWKQDLHNLMHFLSLRLDEHAQWEVRQYAEAIYELLKEHLPRSMEWFDTYRRKLTSEEKDILLDFIAKTSQSEMYKDEYIEELSVLTKLAKRQGIKL